MAAKQQTSIERALRRTPPWKDTPAEPLLVKLRPRRRPWASAQGSFRNYVWAEVQRVGRDTIHPPLSPARRARKLIHEAAEGGARVDNLDFGVPREEAKAAREAAALAWWYASCLKFDRKAWREHQKWEFGQLPPNRSGCSAEVASLLEFVRVATGKKHYPTLSKLFGLAGWHVTPDALRKIAARANIQKPDK
ncbi:MAG: hypothetical protein ACRD1L_12710 [Terriglobales bacterium]